MSEAKESVQLLPRMTHGGNTAGFKSGVGGKGVPVDVGLLVHVLEDEKTEVQVARGRLLGSSAGGRALGRHLACGPKSFLGLDEIIWDGM